MPPEVRDYNAKPTPELKEEKRVTVCKYVDIRNLHTSNMVHTIVSSVLLICLYINGKQCQGVDGIELAREGLKIPNNVEVPMSKMSRAEKVFGVKIVVYKDELKNGKPVELPSSDYITKDECNKTIYLVYHKNAY